MKLTKIEKRIIEAYRRGAKVDLVWHSHLNVKNPHDFVAPFGTPTWNSSEIVTWLTADDFPRVEATVFVK